MKCNKQDWRDLLAESAQSHAQRLMALGGKLHATSRIQRRSAEVEAAEVVASADVLAQIIARHNARALADGEPTI